MKCEYCGKTFERGDSECQFEDCRYLPEGTVLSTGEELPYDGCYEVEVVTCPYCDSENIVSAEFDYRDDAIDDQDEIEAELNREFEKMRL